MIVYRYIKEKYLTDPLSSEGAKKAGGRWNSPGVSMLYASKSASTAQLEILASTSDKSVLQQYRLVRLIIPNDVWKIDIDSLQDVQMTFKSNTTWDAPVHPDYTRYIGDEWINGKETLALIVPSSLCQLDYNVLINPQHHLFSKIQYDLPNIGISHRLSNQN
jgi:RES domain-containing protein